MSVAQLRRRVDAFDNRVGGLGKQSFTLEEHCRMLWQTNRRACEEMAQEGDRAMAFYVGQFAAEEARIKAVPVWSQIGSRPSTTGKA